MPRFSEKTYRRRMMLAMAAYLGCMLLLWPLLGAVSGTALKALLALLPVVPMLYLISLMMRRIRHADELQQRMHLVALGVATMVVSALSLAAGFLAAAKLLSLDGSILIWVFPVIMVTYDVTRWWVGRRYGMEGACDDSSRVPVYMRLLLVAALTVLGAMVFRQHLDNRDFGVLCGMAGVFAAIGALSAWFRWRRKRHHADVA